MKKVLIVDSETKLTLKLVRELKKRFSVELNLNPIDVNYYDFVFVSLNILKEEVKLYQEVDNLICLTNIDSKILKEQMHAIYPNLRFLKYDFSSDELYRVLNNYVLKEECLDIINYLKNDGIKTNLKGFIYLVEIINLGLIDSKYLGEMMKTYLIIANKYQVKESQVERDIRYLINKYNEEKGTIYNNTEYIIKVVNDFLIKEM